MVSHLSEEGEGCLNWFSRNGMQANPTKFQLMVNDCRRTRLEPEPTFSQQSTILENDVSVKLLGIKIDRDVTFKEQVSNVCRKVGLQLSVLKRLSFILNTNVTMAALHSFIKSHLQYFRLVRSYQSKWGMSSIEKLQEMGLGFVYNDYNTSYVDLLRKACIPSVSTAWQQSAVIEVYNALNGLTPKYMKCIFTPNKKNMHSDNKFLLRKCHTTNLSLKSFAYQAESLWTKLPNCFTTSELPTYFKTKIFTWSIYM